MEQRNNQSSQVESESTTSYSSVSSQENLKSQKGEKERDFLDDTNHRFIKIGAGRKIYGSNAYSCRKYTNANFILVNFFEQINNPINQYFLFFGLLQCIPGLSMTYSICYHGIFVFFFMILNVYRNYQEDLRLKIIDEAMRQTKVEGIKKGKEKEITWKKLFPGDVVKIVENQRIPADILVLFSSNIQNQIFHADTSNLDGSSQISKRKGAIDMDMYDVDNGFQLIQKIKNSVVKYDKQSNMNNFIHGEIMLESLQVTLKEDNFLYKGEILKNTDNIYGVILYTG